MFFFGGGKCPNLGVVNVRILGVVNVLLANDSQSANNISSSTIAHLLFSHFLVFLGFFDLQLMEDIKDGKEEVLDELVMEHIK